MMSIVQAFKSNYLKLFAVVAVAAFSPTAVQAIPIDGEVLFGGTVTTDTPNIEDATVLNFGNVVVTDSFGDPALDNVNSGDSATFNDMVLDPFVPMAPLWTVTSADSGGAFDWLFDLSSIDTINRSTSSQLTIFGTGVLSNTNGDQDDTMANFSLSADSSGGRIAFSSTTTSTVPEPATLGLLGLGLLGLGVARRRRGTAASQ